MCNIDILFIKFLYNPMLNYNKFMNYKLLKLNIKIAWFRIFGSFKKINKINHFTSNDLTNSNILIIFPFEERLIRESMKEPLMSLNLLIALKRST